MPLAKIAAKIMAGVSLDEQGWLSAPIPSHVSVKESVFPFIKFAGVDIVLGPEMRSTGEVMGTSERFSIAFAKSQLAAGVVLPKSGNVFMSLAGRTKQRAVELGRSLTELGFQLVATEGTARLIQEAGIEVKVVKKLQEGHPNLIDYLIDGQVRLIINTPSGKGARTDEGRIRAAAVSHGVPCITTIPAADAALLAMRALREEEMTVQALQDRLSTASVAGRPPVDEQAAGSRG
jgi:carbamoyl-phosphate synthase large subunit